MKTLKPILITLLFALSLASCDMDKYPYDKIPLESAVESFSDCQKLRTGMYRDLRIIALSTHAIATELQADGFLPLSYFGNQFGALYRWETNASESTFSTVWSNCYVTIAQCNLLIEGIKRLQAAELFSESEMPLVKNYLGEAHLIRAIAYSILTDKFCAAYDPATAETVYGVPLVDEYSPSSDNTKYPSRATLAATYSFIKEDIRQAKENMTAGGQPSYEYLSTDALTAFEARIALLTRDYDTAIDCAEGLIKDARYPLINNADALQEMWRNDISTEVICQLFSSKQELAPAMGSYFLDETNHKPVFLPSRDIIGSYRERDIRLNSYFKMEDISFSTNEQHRLAVFTKFPGNPEMYEGANNYVNKPKIFRIAEQYLIASEAYYLRGEGEDELAAYDILYELMASRDASVSFEPVNGLSLQQLIRAERERELFGEGFRLSDLKRYGEGFRRQTPQSAQLSYELAMDLNVNSDHTRWLWAIPKTEIDANPQIKSQQNPGY